MKHGYYKKVKKTVHHEATHFVEEQGHYETIREYPKTGGKDVKWVIDIPGVEEKPAYDEEVIEEVWTEYTLQEINSLDIEGLKKFLLETDYVVIKIQEAIIDDDNSLASQLRTEYADIIAQRKQARARIQELESHQTV